MNRIITMSKLPWAKYLLSALGAALIILLADQFLSLTLVSAAGLCIISYWAILQGFNRIKGYN